MGTAADTSQAIEYFEKACRGGIAARCFAVATMYHGMKDEALAQQRFQQACDASVRSATANTAYFRRGASIQSAAAPAFCSQGNP